MTSTNDGKDVKSNQTTGPKGKTYYIELYKSLESRLSESTEPSERTKHLCDAWRRVHSLCQHSAPSTHVHLLSWLQRHTARTVLQTGWQLPKREGDRKHLEDAINDFIAQSREAQASRVGEPLPWEAQLATRGEWFKTIIDKPWDHPVLTLLLNPNGTPPSDDEVLKWLKEERGVTFVMRLHTLVGEKCEDIACSLAACVMDRVRAAAPALCDAGEDDDKASTAPYTGPFADKLRDEAGFTVDVWEMLTDIEFVLQHKRDSQRCIALAKQTPLRGAYQLIERLHSRLETSPREKRLWKTAKQVAILIAHVVIARCMVIPLCSGVARSALYCCARSLAHRAPARLLSAGAALAAPAPTARHLHTFAAAVRAHLPPGNDQVMKPFVCELYVRAITAGMNELEKLKLKTEKEAEGQARASAQTLAAWMLQLGSVVSGSRVAAECALTAFSLHPSGHMYECLVSVPPQVKHNDPKEPKEEATTSEFGSWANDSRSMTNFVKTSETLNMKHTQNQANILSTAILNEGEGLGLSPDLCQDIAVLLSGPRVKTFSWDMEREELLEKCRTYMERTHGGTRALTTELKYLNLDPANFQHLPEDRDDDEDDIYYGIEKGYEHLVQFEEPEEIWNAPQEPDRIDTTSPSFLDDEIIPHRKKKNRRVPHSSNEDSDPLSTVAETKRHQKNKERPHSKERSRKDKKEKKKQEIDPLLPEDQTQEQKSQKIKEKKERKKKEKTPRDSSLASLVGLKVGKSRNKKKTTESALSIINSDYNKQGKTSFQSLNSEISDADDINIDVTTVDDNKSDKGNKVGIIGMPSQSGKKPPNNIDNFTYKPWLPAPTYRPSSSGLSRKHSPGMKAFPDEIRASISKLLEFRRQKAMEPNINRQPKMNAHMVQRNATNAIVNTPDVQIQTNITPKAVIIPDIPKSYIDKQKAEQLAEFKKGVDMIISQGNQMMETRHDSHPVVHKPVIQYAKKNKTKPHVLDVMKLNTESQLAHSNSLKMSDIVNVSSDRMILEKMQRQNSCSAIYDIVRPPRPTSSVSNIAQERPASVAMSGQNDYLNFLKEYQLARNKAIRNTAMMTMATSTEQVLDMSTKASKDIKKDVKPLSRVTPIVPDINKAERKPQQCAKPLTQQKKPEASLNTFSRLSYMHKNKQTEMKNKSATENPTLNFTTYQEVSTELDEIIRKHKNEQMKVIQAKNDKLVRAKETPSSSSKSIIEDSRKSLNSLTQALSHPMLSNLLEQNTITYASSPSVCQNQSQFKNTSPKKSVLPAKSSLTTSDQNDLLNLLRQQSKLNSGFYQTTSMYPSTSNSIDNVSTPANNSTSYPKQKIVTPTKAVNIQSSLETKIINIISNSLTKPPDNLILKNGSGVKSKPLILSGKKNAKDPDNVKKTETDKTQAKKPTIISDARNHNNWESVMNDILKHKTPRRGPNALDVALNKSSYEKAFENSLKKPSTMPVIINTISEDRKYPIKSQPSNSVIPQNSNKAKILKQPSIQTKAIDLKKSVIQSKSESSGTKKATKVNSSEMSKKLPHDQQRKQFTYTGPKHDDPFISGIPNSDYDLLEELMDDDLRKEIGELSSDEEGFNTAAQSFLKTPKNDEKRVSVEFNPPLPEVSAKKPVTDIRCLNTSHSNDENIHTTTQSLVKNSENTIPQANNSVRQPQGLAVNVTKDNTCMKDMVPQSIPTNVATIPNYTNVNALTNTQIDRNIYITSVPQQSPVQNVVLIGSELVYEGYSTIQTPINNIVSNIVPNTYVAVNNTPNMTLYQSTPFAAPVVNPMLIGNATLSVPIINTIPCAATISVQPTPINQVSETVFHASTLGSHTQINSANVNVEKRDDNIGTLTSDPILHNDIKSVNERLLDLNIKTNERKVLSEVQERLVVTENTEKVRTQVTDYEKNLRKDVSDDRERLKKKRMAIINRDIYHRCGDTPIALSYSPLPPPKALLDTHTEVVPETLTSVSCLPQAATNLENNVPNKEESLPNTEVKSQSNIDDDIKDLASPVTPDNNDNCKENKSNPKVPCRRILLRSSNKIKSKPDIDTAITENPKRKSKVKLKPETPKCDEEADNISSQNKNICKDASVPKRASKRLSNKTLKRNQNNIIKGKIENQEKINKKLSSKKTNHNVTEFSNNIIEDGLLDIEAELQGARIPTIPVILPKVNVAEIKQSQQEDIVVPSDHTISDEVTASNEKGNIIPSPETDEILEQTTDSEINDISNEVDNKHLNFETDANTIISNENPKNIVQLKSQIEKIEVSDDSAVNVETEVMLKILTQQNKTVETQSSNLQSVNDSNSFQSDHIIKTTAKTAFSLTDSTKVTNDNNSDNLSENNNIDLDMTVTCEEENAAQKIPVIAGIKYGKDTNICNKIIKQNQNSQVLKINQNETTSTLDSPVSDINSDSKNVTSVDTVLESIKTTDTESQCYEKVTGKKPLEASFLNANKTSNLDDDIQIIDDNLNQSSPIANCDKVKKESNTNHQTMTKPNSEVTNTSVATVSARNDDPKIISDLSEVSQSYKDSVIIEELPSVHSGAVTKKCVRVKLPNGRTFKATVYGEVHGNFDTLFANPSIKSALLNSLNSKKRYTMNIKQVSTVANGDPSRILSTRIQAFKPMLIPPPPGQVETIDLLSDDEEVSHSTELNYENQALETEYGRFKISNISEIDKNTLAGHKIKLRHKAVVALKRIDETTNKDVYLSLNSKIPGKTLENTDSVSAIADKTVSVLKDDIKVTEHKTTSGLKNTIDVVEIDDSSKDGSDIKCSAKVQSESKINELKDVLLQELGVNSLDTSITPHKVKDGKNINISEEIISIDDDDDLPNEQPNCNSMSSKSSERFNKNKRKNNIIDKICCVKLTRCDDLIEKSLSKTTEILNYEDKARFDSVCSSVQAFETQDGGDKNSDNTSNYVSFEDFSLIDFDTNAIEPEAERSSSPVIELFDVIASLHCSYLTKSELVLKSIPLSCEAEWLTSKRMLQLRTVNYLASIPINQDNRVNGKGNININNLSDMPAANTLEEKQPPVKVVPRLISMVLKLLQDTDAIYQYKFFRGSLNLSAVTLKRKSSSLQPDFKPKMSRLEVTNGEEQNTSDNLISSNSTLDSSATYNNVSISILEDVNSICILEASNINTSVDNSDLSLNKTDVSTCTSTCDGDRYLNEQGCDKANDETTEACSYEDLLNMPSLSEAVSDLIDADFVIEPRSSSPVIEISHLLLDDYINDIDNIAIPSPKIEIKNIPSLLIEENNGGGDKEPIESPKLPKYELELESKTSPDITENELNDAQINGDILESVNETIPLPGPSESDITQVSGLNEIIEDSNSVKENPVSSEIDLDKNILSTEISRENYFKNREGITTVLSVSTETLSPESGIINTAKGGCNVAHKSSDFVETLLSVNAEECFEGDKETYETELIEHDLIVNGGLDEQEQQVSCAKDTDGTSFKDIVLPGDDINDTTETLQLSESTETGVAVINYLKEENYINIIKYNNEINKPVEFSDAGIIIDRNILIKKERQCYDEESHNPTDPMEFNTLEEDDVKIEMKKTTETHETSTYTAKALMVESEVKVSAEEEIHAVGKTHELSGYRERYLPQESGLDERKENEVDAAGENLELLDTDSSIKVIHDQVEEVHAVEETQELSGFMGTDLSLECGLHERKEEVYASTENHEPLYTDSSIKDTNIEAAEIYTVGGTHKLSGCMQTDLSQECGFDESKEQDGDYAAREKLKPLDTDSSNEVTHDDAKKIHAGVETDEISGFRESGLSQECRTEDRKEDEVYAAREISKPLENESIKVSHNEAEEINAVGEIHELSGLKETDLLKECGLEEIKKDGVYADRENTKPLDTDSSIKDTNIEAAEIYTVGGTHKLSGCMQTDLSQECGFDESKEQDGDYAAREKLKPLDTDSSNEVTHDDAKKIHAGVETDEISGFRESGLSQECRSEDRKEDEVYAAREISKPLEKESIKVSHNEAEKINAVGEIHELSGLKETDLLKECGLEEIKKDGVYADRENTKPLDTDSSIKVTRDKAEEIHAVEETHELSGFMETDLSLECGLHKAEEEVYASSIKYTNIEAKDEDIAARENIKLLDNDSANEVMKLKDEAHEEAKKMHADVGTQGLFVFSEGGLSQKCGLEERKEDVECDLDGIKEDGVYEANENSKPLDTESFKVAHDAKEINAVRETLFRKTDLSQECSLNGRKEKDEVYAATENCEPLATDSSMKDTLYEAENINNVKFDDQLSGDMQTVLLLERGMNDNKVENEILQSEDTDLIVKSVIKDQLIDDGDIDITYPSSNLIEFDTSVKSKDNGDDFKDCVETYQLVKVTKSDLSLENDAKDNETTTGTIKINKNEQSQIDQSIQTRDVMVIQNSSSVRGFIMDHEYITSISVACEDRRCTQKVDDTIQLPSHCPILIFDDEATEEITEEIVEFLSDEVIDDITLHNDTVSNDSRQTDDNASQESVISSFDNGAEIHNIDESTSEKNIGDDSMNNSDSMEPLDSKDEDLEDTGAIWKVSVRNIDNVEETSFTSCDISTEGIINKYLASLGKDQSDLAHTVNKFKYEDPEAGTCFILPIIEKKIETNNVVREKVQDSYKVDVNSEESNNPFVIDTDEDLKCILPERTYSKYKREIRRSKRRMNMSDITFCGKRIRYGPRRNSKTIDYPKPSKIDEISYAKEYKTLFDYCSTIHFSYSIPFHKEYIDVHKELESWPIKGNCIVVEDIIDSEMLFRDTPDGSFNPIQLSLAEEIKVEFDENDYKSINIVESNFSMGFGDGSGRVKQEQRDGEYTFSAATLSDVKQIQPLLPSEEKHKSFRVENPSGIVDNNQDLYKMRRFYDYLHLKEKVRSFFEKTKTELSSDWAENHKKNDFRNKNVPENWPFCLASPEYMQPAPVSVTVNVVQVGQLPVSAAAQNPVTCDPRVTHVSNVSPSQCSPQNNSGDDLQTSIKSEYTELTTADITLPLMQEYVQHHHSMPNKSQETTNMHSCDDNIPMATEIKSVVKIELMEETSQDQLEENIRYETHRLQLSENNVSNGSQYHYDNITSKMVLESDANVQSVINSSEDSKVISKSKQPSDSEKTDQIAHAMNAAGITATQEKTTDAEALVDIISQNAQSNVLALQTSNYSKPTPITTMALQQALAQILPPPLNQTNASENNQPNTTNPQVLHIVQGNSTPSVINKTSGPQLLHIVQNKNNTNGTPASQPNTFSGLSLVDGAIQQNGNLLHIVNTGQKNSNNPGQLLKRVNLLTNLANVQGSNDKMVHVLCKSTDGKSIQLPPQRSMVLRLQPLDPPNLQATAKQNEVQDVNPSNSALPANSANGKETAQEIKSRSLYEENYAKFVQNGDPKPGQEKATSLPKFNQVFGKQVYQDKQDEVDSNNLSENQECQQEENMPLEQMTDIGSPPMLIQKPQSQTATPQPNLVQQIKQSIGPMNIPMHGGVIYTRQIPVNIGNGQTINLITVPSTEIVDDSNQKLNADGKFGNQEGNSQIIKIVTNNQPATTANGASDDNNTQLGPTNEAKPQQNPQPQPVLTQMRIKLPMLSKAPQMVGGTRVVRPSFFQIQRNVIGGANQQVYQQLVLTAAPQIGQSIRLPAQVHKPKTPSETQSSSESQMSSSTLEQLREFDMVLEQVKERSTVQPGSSTSNNNFSKLNSSADTTDTATPSTSTLKQDPPTPVLFSVGTTQPINIANFVNRKSTITSTTTSSFVRSPDSTGIAESPTSSTHVHLPHTVQPTTESCASSSCASEAAAATTSQPKPKKKSKPKSSSSSNPFKINSTPPKTSTQKPLEDEQTTQRILYILAEYKEQVENSPDKDKPAPRRRNNPAAPAAGTSKRKKSSSGSRKRDSSPIGEDSCRTMGSEDSSCGTSLGECNECLESHSPEESPRKVVRRLTFEQETTQVTQTRTTTTTIPQRNVIVADGQAFAVRSTAGKPATTVLMPANYLLPVSMVKGGQQIAIVTNRGPKLLVGAGEGGSGGTLLFQRLIGPAGLKPVLTRPGVRHIRLPTAALHNLQTFNIATPAATVQPPDSTASPAPPAPAPPDLVDTRAMSSPWTDRTSEGETKQDKGNSSPEGSEPWNLPSSSIADDYGYEEIVRTDNMDRTVLDAIPDRYSPDMEAQRIFDKMFDVDSKKSMYDSRCSYDIDASDDDKAYHQVVQRKDGRHHRLTHVSAAALRHKYAILEHELRLQKSLSEECEDLGVDSPSASELFPEAELLFAPSPAHEQTIDQCHTPQPLLSQGIPQPDLDDQIASDGLLTHDRQNELDINLDDVGEIVTVGEDGMTTIQLDHEEFARSHPNTTFHSEPEDGEMPPFTIAQGLKSRPISFVRGVPGTVVMAPQTTVISQATVEPVGTQNTVKFTDIDNIINAMPSPQHNQNIMPSVLVKDDLHKFDNILNEREVLPTSAIVHSTGNVTQVIRRAETRDRFSTEDDILRRHDKVDDRESNGDSGPERPSELFWNNTRQDRRFNFDKCCKYDESDVNNTRLDSVIKAARRSDSPSDAPPLRTYPARRSHIASPHTSHNTEERSRPKERCHDEGRRRASNRGVVKRGCHCCNGSTAPPKPKKSKKRPDFHNH